MLLIIVHSSRQSPPLCPPYPQEQAQARRCPCPLGQERRIPLLRNSLPVLPIRLPTTSWCVYFRSNGSDQALTPRNSAGHAQEHSTSHGSMEQTTWAMDGDGDTVREIQGRKFSAGDSGAPMLCSMVCKELGRHAHISFCRSSSAAACKDHEVEHIKTRMLPEPARAKDWITHSLHWARSGVCR